MEQNERTGSGSDVLQKLLSLAAAGAAGTLARYTISQTIQRSMTLPMFWSTLAVNVLGCLLAGALWTFFELRFPATSMLRMLVLTGFLGAFTTFSAYMLDTNQLIQSGQWQSAFLNFVIQNVAGFGALLLGAYFARIAHSALV